MDYVIHDPWTEMVGSILTDPKTSAFLRTLHLSPKKVRIRGLGLRYLAYRMDGVEFVHRDEKIIHIHIHVEPDSSSRAWVGNLPHGLQRGMARGDVHRLLGNPHEGRRPSSGELIDGWMVGQSRVSLAFEPVSLRLRLITMSREPTEETIAIRGPNS